MTRGFVLAVAGTMLIAVGEPSGSHPVAIAQGAASVPRGLAPEDMLAIREIGEIAVSPDAASVVFTVSTSDLATNRTRSQVMIVPTSGGEPSPIVELPDGVSHIRWSRDSTRIAFFGSRDGKSAIWTLHMGTRALTRVCDYDRSNSYLSRPGDWLAWSPDGRRLAFAGTNEPVTGSPDPVVATRIQYKSRTSFSDNRRAHIFLVPAAGGQPSQLTSGDFDEHSIDWMASGREILFVSNRQPDPDALHNYDIFAVDVSSQKVRRLTDTAGVETSPRVSPDGQWIAYLASTRAVTTIDSAAEDSHVWVLPAGGGPARELNASLDRRVMSLDWAPDSSSILFTAQDHGKTALYRVAREGGASAPVVDQQAQVGPFTVASNGSVVFGLSTATEPREIFHLAPSSGAPRRLTSLNRETLAGWRLSTPELVRFTSRDGVPVEGWFYPALGSQGRSPLLLNIHGGPHGMFGYVFDPMTQVYAARGYGVLAINPRGSAGYGQRFSDGSLKNWGGGDYEDLMAGVDHVLKTRTDVDADRLAVTGRSYGGFMTNWVITQTDRFKAAVAVASVANLISFYGTSLYQDLIHAEFDGHPWDGNNFELLWKWSPLAHVRNVKTPTLFVHGEQDNDVHVTEPEAMYMGLRRRGVPTAFARYPREGHGFREPKHRVDALARTVAWLDRYLMPHQSQPH